MEEWLLITRLDLRTCRGVMAGSWLFRCQAGQIVWVLMAGELHFRPPIFQPPTDPTVASWRSIQGAGRTAVALMDGAFHSFHLILRRFKALTDEKLPTQIPAGHCDRELMAG